MGENNKDTGFGKITSTESKNEIGTDGSFVRQKNRFITPFGEGPDELPVEADRYRLIWTPLCPWATRQVIALKLLGLDKVISIGTTGPKRTEKGWEFSLDKDGTDPILGIRYLPEIYAKTDPEYTGRATVPAVIDIKKNIVVNNDYHNLTNYFEIQWRRFHKKDAPDLYPEELKSEIDKLNEIIFDEVNNGVYKCAFSITQEAYEKHFDILFDRLDWLENYLSNRRFLFGDYVTDADIRLYVTLARFDVAYYYTHKTNRNRLIDFHNLWNYTKDLYQIPEFREATDFEAIKTGYYNLNSPYGIIPKGPDESIWNESNDRARLSSHPEQKFK
jgi:putative glutathione S-transferase